MWIQDKFLTWWLHGPRYGWSKLHRRLFEGGFLSKPLPTVNSLEDIQACMRKIEYKKDSPWELFDCVSYPQRVWDKKKDDCDGYSVLAAELLSRWNPETEPVMVTAMVAPIDDCHSVCVFKLGGNLRYFNNKELVGTGFQGYKEIVAEISKRPKKLICWDVVKPDTLEVLEFHLAENK